MSSDERQFHGVNKLGRCPVLPPSGLTEAERDAWYAEHERTDAENADKWWNERGRANAAFYAALKGFQP